MENSQTLLDHVRKYLASGKLLTPLLKQEISFSIRYASALKLMPYDWDPVKGQLEFKPNGYCHVGWCVVRTIFVIHCGLIWINFGRSIVDPNDTFELKAFTFFGAAAYSVPSIGQLLIRFHLREIVEFFNSSMKFYNDFEDQHWKKGSPPFGIFVGSLIGLFMAASVTQPYFIHLFYFVFPFSKVFFFSSVFLDKNSSNLLICLAALPSLWACLIGWGTCMFLGSIMLHFFYTFLFITQQISACCPEGQITDSARQPNTAFKTYRSLQLFCTRANNLIQSSLLIFVNLSMSLVVVANNCLIIFHSILPMSGFIVFGTYSVSASGALFIMYVKLGELHHFSKGFVRSWKFSRKYDSPTEKTLMIKLFNSCKINRIEMGNVGYFQKPTSIRIIGKIIFYTTKFLMVMRPKTTTVSPPWAMDAE